MKKIAVFFAEGYEEIEALTVVDLCRRAGIDTKMVSVTENLIVTGAHQIPVMMDEKLDSLSFDELDMIVLPGGMPGTKNLEKVPALMDQVKTFAKNGKFVAAICAAPSILGHLGVLEGKRACCYPGFEAELTGAEVTYRTCETDGNVITARGMGCAIEFASAIIDQMCTIGKGEEIEAQIIYHKKEQQYETV